MDLTVYPGTRIAALPRPLRPPALLLRNIVPERLRRYRYPYRSDDLATIHLNPFIEDPEFAAAYEHVAEQWRGGLEDRRWRTWLLSRLARERAGMPTDDPAGFAEFGVYRGSCASIILATAGLAPQQRFALFDTFTGTPDNRLTGQERATLAGRLADTSQREVERLLDAWRSQVIFHPGDVFETLETAEVGPLGFVHIDINGSAATIRCLEYAYPRLVQGAVIVLDDYGAAQFADLRRAVDGFFAAKPEEVIALPTSQGLVLKH